MSSEAGVTFVWINDGNEGQEVEGEELELQNVADVLDGDWLQVGEEEE